MTATAETSLLGACLSAAFALPAALEEGVTAGDFYLPGHQTLWGAMVAVYNRLDAGEHLDPVLVVAELGKNGDAAFIHSLMDACPLASNARRYAREVLEASLTRKVQSIVLDMQDSPLRGEELLASLQDRAFALERNPKRAVTGTEALENLFEEVNNPTQATLSWPWREIDYLTRGLRPGTLTYLAGRPGHGKTAAALALAEHVLDIGKRVLFLSLEMSSFQLAVRLAQRNGFRSEALYAKDKASSADFQSLLQIIGEERWSRLHIDDVDHVGQIGSIVRRVKPDLIVLDYIGLLDIGKDTRTEGTTKNSRILKRLTRQYQVPIVALVQLSRGGPEDRKRPPGLHRLRDSGALEQDGDVVIFAWREVDASNGEVLLPSGSFIVAKSRMGRQGKVDFNFDGDSQHFRLIDHRRAS